MLFAKMLTICLLVVLLGSDALLANETKPRRILAVLAGDTDDPRIGRHVVRDLQNIRRLLEDLGRNLTLEIQVLEGSDFTREALRTKLSGLPITEHDVVVFYLAGHGGFDKRQGPFFLMDGGQGAMFRSEVRTTLLEKSPRLVVLLSDTCNEYLDSTEFRAGKELPEKKTMECLFLAARGVVDISAVSEGEYAWGNRQQGGFFTFSLVSTLRKPFQQLDLDKDGFLYWHEVIPQLQENTQASYALFRSDVLKRSAEFPARVSKTVNGQAFQSVRVYALPPVWRLGVRILENGGDGVKIALVHEHTPAFRADLRPGDVLLKIGTKALRGAADFQKALEQAGPTVPVEVRRAPSNRIEVIPIPLMPWAAGFTDG